MKEVKPKRSKQEHCVIHLISDSLESVLGEAVSNGAPVLVNEVGEMPVTLHFSKLTADALEFSKGIKGFRPKKDLEYDLRFKLGDISFQFFSKIWEADPSDCLFAHRPEKVIVGSRREYARVCVTPEIQLVGELRSADSRWNCRCLDISHIGARVQLENSPEKKPNSGMPGVLELKSGGETRHVTAIVMWCRDDTLGLLLPEMRQVSPAEKAHPWLSLLRSTVVELARNSTNSTSLLKRK